MDMLIKGTAQQLAEAMANISIKHYREKWAIGLEFELWGEINGNQNLLNTDEAKKLSDVAEICDGWIRMNNRTGNLEFLSTDVWANIFENENPYGD